MKPLVLIVLFTGLLLNSCAEKTKSKVENPESVHIPTVSGDTVETLGDNIMVIFQDSKNIYWFGSWKTGLYRYDGKSIINYTSKHGLPHDRVDEIKEDQSGNLYINGCYPFSAITKYDGKTFSVLNVIASNDWKLLSQDIWFKHPYEQGQVYRYDGNRLHELTIPKHPVYSNPFEIYSIYKDVKGNIWFGTNPIGVCRYNGKTFDWISEKDVTELHNGPANGVRSITEDKEGYLWFNTAYRYSVYDSAPSNNQLFYNRQNSIGSLDGKKDGDIKEYLSIVKDNSANLWIATYGNGVWKYDGKMITHFPIQVNAKDINLFSIYKDNGGELWVGTPENGAFKFNGQRFEPFTK